MSWAVRTEHGKDAGSADIAEYRRDRGRGQATVRSRSPAGVRTSETAGRPGARELGINHLVNAAVARLIGADPESVRQRRADLLERRRGDDAAEVARARRVDDHQDLDLRILRGEEPHERRVVVRRGVTALDRLLRGSRLARHRVAADRGLESPAALLH